MLKLPKYLLAKINLQYICLHVPLICFNPFLQKVYSGCFFGLKYTSSGLACINTLDNNKVLKITSLSAQYFLKLCNQTSLGVQFQSNKNFNMEFI